jgi:hypothetical protein
MVVMTTTFDPKIGKATRFKKGAPSPNPGGRPKSRLLSEALRLRLADSKPGDAERRANGGDSGQLNVCIRRTHGRRKDAAELVET